MTVYTRGRKRGASRFLAGLFTVLAMLLVGPNAIAAESDPRAPDRQALSVILKEFEAAFNRMEIEPVLRHLDAAVIVTWLNGDVTHGAAEARSHFEQMMKGPGAILKAYRTQPTVSGQPRFIGDTGLAFGTSNDYFEMTNGTSFNLKTNWNAVVTKQGDNWKVVSINFSTNAFDNAVLDKVKRYAWMLGAAGFVAGALLMGLVLRLRRRYRR